MKQFAFLLALLPLLGSCAAAPYAAAAAVGMWTHDEYSKSTVSIPVEANVQDVWAAAKAVAADHVVAGEKLDIQDGAMRIEGRLMEANVLITVLLFPNTDKITEVKVSAHQGFRGRENIAQQLAEEIVERL